MRRLTVPKLRARKVDGVTAEPIVMLTAYTARQAQLLDAHCDVLLVGDLLGQVIYGLPSSVPVTLEMMANHAAAVVRGSLSFGWSWSTCRSAPTSSRPPRRSKALRS